MITLPLYVIEHVNGKWELYNTRDCSVLVFDTKQECEEYLNKLKQLKT